MLAFVVRPARALSGPLAFAATCALSIVAGCSCAATPAATDTGARIDAPVALDAPATSDTPMAMDVRVAIDAPDTDAPAATDVPPATDAPSMPTVTMHDVAIYGNCFPVPPDPVIAFWEVDVAGASGSLATLVSATLTLTGPSTITQTLTVDVTSIALTGGTGTAAMRKTAGAPSTLAGCGEACSGTTWRLDLVFMIDGRSVPASLTGNYGCVF